MQSVQTRKPSGAAFTEVNTIVYFEYFYICASLSTLLCFIMNCGAIYDILSPTLKRMAQAKREVAIMVKKSILGEFSKYVSLNVLGMICLSCYIIVDTFFISKALGATGLASLNFSIAVFSILHGFGLMVGIGGATRYAVLKSEGKHDKADSIFTHSLITGLSFAVVFVVTGIFLTVPLSKMLGADSTTLPLTEVYIRTILYFAPFFFLNNILIAFIRNDNNPKLAMAGMVTGSFSNIVLDYIFLFPLSMGMFGAALATGLSLVLSVCVLSLHFWRKQNQFTLCKCKVRFKKIINLLFLGSSAFVGELSFAVSLITFNLVILSIAGNIGVAAYGIVANIALIAITMFTGVAQGIQPLVSRGYGSGDRLLIKKVLKYAMIVVFSLSFLTYCLIYFFSDFIVSVFNSEANNILASLASNGLKIFFTGILFAGVNVVAAAFFSAITNAKTGLLISILRSCVILIPMVIVLSTIMQMNGVWLSFALTELIVCFLSVVMIHKFLCKISL